MLIHGCVFERRNNNRKSEGLQRAGEPMSHAGRLMAVLLEKNYSVDKKTEKLD